MKRAEKFRCYLGRLLGLLLVMFFFRGIAKPGEISMGGNEQTFPVLQTKTGAYTNVTVTKKTKDWVFILHAQGVCNIKATDLSTDARVALGYEEAPKSPEEQEEAAAAKASAAKLPHVDLSGVKRFAADWRQNREETKAQMKAFFTAHVVMLCGVLGGFVVLYVVASTVFWLICRKTHIAPGPLVWVPILQLIPLLRAANMSPVWFLALFVPVLNLVAIIIFSIKIVKSRGKGFWVSVLLIFPLTSWIGMLYLAFSSSAPVRLANNEVLSLETA